MSDTDVINAPRRGPRAVRGRAALVATLVVAGLVVLALTGSGEVAGAEQTRPGRGETATAPVAPTSPLTDDVAAQIRSGLDQQQRQVEVRIPPGAVYPWRTHPGPVLIRVAEGELVHRSAEYCVDREYRAGETLLDPGGGTVHTVYNPGTRHTRVVATVLGAPGDGPLTVPAVLPPPAVCPLPTP